MAHPVNPLSDQITVDLWKKYEDVAMHFNDLIMRWRLHAMGGLAGLVTVAGFVVGDAATLAARYRAMLILTGVLTFAWVAVALIDLLYYRKLLEGAVKALVELEGKYQKGGAINFSRRVSHSADEGAKLAPWLFYGFGLIPLLLIISWAIYQLVGLPPGPEVPIDRLGNL
jgi:hypothetical protein